MNLKTHISRQMKWSYKTFGPSYGEARIVDHIKKELKEIQAAESQDKLSEWVDVILLAIDGAWRSGHLPSQICTQIQRKLLVNENREWTDWRKAKPGKAIEHKRGKL